MSSRSTATIGSAVLTVAERKELASERTIVRDGLLRLLRPGELRYLIPSSWYANWTKFVGMAGYGHWRGDPKLNPGPVDLSQLVDENDKLLPGLVEVKNYRALPEDTWNVIVKKYGISEFKNFRKHPEPIKRPVVLTRNNDNFNVEVVELYPLEVSTRLHNELSKTRKLVVSPNSTIGNVEMMLKKECQISENVESRLWCVNATKGNQLELSEPSSPLMEPPGSGKMEFVLEIQETKGHWHCPNAHTVEKLSAILGYNVRFAMTK